MNRSLLATLLALIFIAGREGLVCGFSPSAVTSIQAQALNPALTSHPKIAYSKVLAPLKFTPKDDGETTADQPFIRPALHNSSFFRAISILYALLFAIYTTSKSPAATTNAFSKLGKHLVLSSKAAASIHILSFGIWFGTVFYTTFVAGITMFKNLPRRTFGSLQSKLFPLYFQLCTGTIALQVSNVVSHILCSAA